MSRDEALSILRDSPFVISWDRLTDEPCIDQGSVFLNGHFTREEIEALLFFFAARAIK